MLQLLDNIRRALLDKFVAHFIYLRVELVRWQSLFVNQPTHSDGLCNSTLHMKAPIREDLTSLCLYRRHVI